jgi:hypothetical protein
MPLDERSGPIVRNLLRYLGDGEWHSLEKTVQAAIPKVHPGRAARRAELNRKLANKRRGVQQGPPERTKNVDLDRIIRIGARSLVKDATRISAFEHDRNAGTIRIRPDKLSSARALVEKTVREGGEAAFQDTNDEG